MHGLKIIIFKTEWRNLMIIVTGGAGFIGSNIVKKLNDRGIKDILIVDNLKRSEKYKNLNALYFKDYVDKNDFLSQLNILKENKIEAIFHEGACSDTLELDGKYMMHNNYEYTKTLFELSMENSIRFFYASSASVYGDGKRGFDENVKNEYPLNIYAFSKFLFDRYLRRVIDKTPSQAVGLRYFNVYGPQENHKGRMASVVFKFHNQINRENKMTLFKDSEKFFRDFVYVDDVVNVNLFFFDNPEIKGIFNCGTSKAKSFLKIAEIMKTLYNYPSIEFIDFPEDLKGKYQSFTQSDNRKLENAGYTKAFHTLEEGISEYVKILKESGGYFKL